MTNEQLFQKWNAAGKPTTFVQWVAKERNLPVRLVMQELASFIVQLAEVNDETLERKR